MRNIKYNIIILFSIFVSSTVFAQMSGYKIGIDPGHGGSDPGALGVNGSALPDEADIVLNVGKEIQKKFQNLGAAVVMTRTTDVALTLTYRRNLMNQQNPDAYVSVHENSFTSSSANGTETFRHTNNGGANSQSLATKVQAKMVADMGFTNRGVKNANFTAISTNASIPAALTEGCFLSNQTEWNYITKASNQLCHANAIKNGILDYLGLNNLIDNNCNSTSPPNSNSGNVAPLGSLYDVTSELSSAYSARKAFDGTTGTRWNSNGVENFNYFIIQLNQYYSINKFVVKHASSAGLSSNLNTERFRILYWNGTGWSQSVNYNNSSKLGITTFNASVSSAKWIALVIDDPTFTSDKYARIPEFEIYGTANGNRLANNNNEAPNMLNFNTSTELNISVSAEPNITATGKVQFVINAANDEQVSVIIRNVAGQLVRRITNISGNTSVTTNLSNLPSGVYFYNLETNGKAFSKAKKLLVQ